MPRSALQIKYIIIIIIIITVILTHLFLELSVVKRLNKWRWMVLTTCVPSQQEEELLHLLSAEGPIVSLALVHASEGAKGTLASSVANTAPPNTHTHAPPTPHHLAIHVK